LFCGNIGKKNAATCGIFPFQQRIFFFALPPHQFMQFISVAQIDVNATQGRGVIDTRRRKREPGS